MALPEHFIDLKDFAPSIEQDVRYFSDNNFIGRPITGYQASKCILTERAALRLAQLQERLKPLSLGLKIYDCYRPQQAVDDFIAWGADLSDQKMKTLYYPNIDKSTLFEQGYLAKRSGHSRGSTVDLTLIQLLSEQPSQELDMGTYFDYLDELSHPSSTLISLEAQKNRRLLKDLMNSVGFLGIKTEWWHFTLEDEPFPDTYFNFPIL